MQTPTPSVVYDLETKKTFAEVGGANKQHLLEVSFLGLYSYTQNQYFSFYEKDLPKLEAILLAEKPTLIGFNSISFDNNVLQPYFKNLVLNDLPQVDILADIYRTLGFRMKLESVAQATLGEGKSGSGLDAIKYFREGNFEALSKYCLDDVRITRDVYEYGFKHGYILYTSAGESYRMPVQWSSGPTIAQVLKQAFDEHKQVTLTYLHITETSREVVTTKADILHLTDKFLTAYAYTQDAKLDYLVDRVLDVEVEAVASSFQPSLF